MSVKVERIGFRFVRKVGRKEERCARLFELILDALDVLEQCFGTPS